MSVLIKGMDMPETCMDCPFKGFDRAGGRGNICTIDESITLHAVLDGVDVKFIRMGDCPLVEVVHCKDCTYMERGVKDSNEVWCCWHDSRMMESDFCSRGIKEQGDGNETH